MVSAEGMRVSGLHKELKLNDGRGVLLRETVRDDFEMSVAFFRRLPEKERLYLRRDVTKRQIIEERYEEIEKGLSVGIVAVADERIVGDGLLYSVPHGWTRVTGEMRLVIDTDYRGNGLGAKMAREIFILAVKKDLRKLECCVMETQQGQKRMLERLGFVEEGVLKEFATDLRGRPHDLILMGMKL